MVSTGRFRGALRYARCYAHATIFSLIWLWAGGDLVQLFYESAPRDRISTILFHWRWVAPLAAAVATAGVWRASVKGTLNVTGPRLRVLAYLPLVALLASTLLDLTLLGSRPSSERESAFFAALLSLTALWGLLIVRFPRGEPGRFSRAADVALMNALILLILTEGLLTIWAHASHSPLFSFGSAEARLKAKRRDPGEPYFDFFMNSRGYHDEEFFVASPGDLVVGVLADSFGMGTVPYDYNFVTVAERELAEALGSRFARVALHNYGVPGAGPEEYAFLLETEVLPTKPALVVVALFVGNDVMDARLFGQPRRPFRYSLTGWLTWIVPARLLSVSREIVAHGGEVTRVGRTAGEVPAYLADPSLEPPTFSTERFLEIELRRLEICNPENPETIGAFRGLARALRYFSDRLGDRLVVAVIPDEFQVNDRLYDELLRERPAAARYGRDRPQEWIRDRCREMGLSCLDLLPALREAELEGRTYHLRDTHLNAHGNRVAGNQLASYLVGHVR